MIVPVAECRRSDRAFALPNLMVAMAIFLVVLAGVTSSHLFGLRMFEINRAKLGASDEARATLAKLVEEIRAGKRVRVGNGSLQTFQPLAANQLQQGNALQIFPTLNSNLFIRYFWDSSDQSLKRASSEDGNVVVVANSISNSLVFTAEDFHGNILTNNQNNRVIGLTLSFFQLHYPTVQIGPGNYFDYYQLRSRITRRALE